MQTAIAIRIGMRNRQKDEIMRDILYSAQGGAGITKIMFHAYLTHGQAKEYTQSLIRNGLLDQDSESGSLRQFRTTPKGVEYLNAIESMSDMLAIETRRAAKPAFLL
jgi:predicted transcriptional regulator